jgi:hypothetical protein
LLSLDIRILLLHVATVMDMSASIISSNPAKLHSLIPASRTKKPIKRPPSIPFDGVLAHKSWNRWVLWFWLPTLTATSFNLSLRQGSSYGMEWKLATKSLPLIMPTMGVTLLLREEIMLYAYMMSKLRKLHMPSRENSGINQDIVTVSSQSNSNLKTLLFWQVEDGIKM